MEELTGLPTNARRPNNRKMPIKSQIQKPPQSPRPKKHAGSASAEKAKPPEKDKPAPDAMAAVLKLLAPLIEFHTATEDSDEDIRIFWDVRVIRGASAQLAHVSGSSSMPGLLGVKLMAESTSMIISEIDQKVARPLAAKFQDLVTQIAQSEADELDADELEFVGSITGEEGAALAEADHDP